LPEPAGFRRILVINVCRIGDTLLATPALRALARAWPGARITALGHRKRVEVLASLPWIAQTSAISKTSARWLGRLPRPFRAPRQDLALVYGFDEPLVAYALRAARRVIAYRQRDEALNRALYRAVPAPAFQSAHSVHLDLQLTDALGLPHAGYRLAYRMTEAEGAWADARLRSLGAAAGALLVGLQIASFPTKAYRDWPREHFLAFAQRLRAGWPKAHFLLFGGPGDRQRTAWLARELASGCTVLAGALTLRQTAAMMSRLQLYVGVDTGPTHLASCFDVPLVGLYHCYSPSRLIGPLEHPCFYPVDHPRPYGCAVETPMAEIAVDAVLAAAERALREHPPAQARATR